MGSRLFLLCCVVFTRATAQDDKYYKTDITPGGVKGVIDDNVGFTKPLDFAAFSPQFFNHGDSFNQGSMPTANFDAFGSETKHNPNSADVFPMNFQESGGSNGFVKTLVFPSAFSQDSSASDVSKALRRPPSIEGAADSPTRISYSPLSKTNLIKGKSNYPAPYDGLKSDHSPKYKPNSAVYANSEDIEVFYPPGKTLLPHLNGRPRPYHGYRSLADAMDSRQTEGEELHMYKPTKRHYPSPKKRASYLERRPQVFYNEEAAESRYDEAEADDRSDENSEDLNEQDDESSGYRYQYDDDIKVPDLVIKTYPYERQAYDDSEFTRDYEQYTKSLETDLEKEYGVPDFKFEQYKQADAKELTKDSNCQQVEGNESGNICHICKNPKTGAKYEQCSYEKEPTNRKYSYKSEKSSKERPVPVKYRYKRSETSYVSNKYYSDPELNEKRKHKKFKLMKKQLKRKIRQSDEPEGPPPSYNGPEYTYEGPTSSYEGPKYPYEGPRHSYEGPSSHYEGPSLDYEGPDHDDYYDRTDDRIAPEASDDYNNNQRSRYRQGPKADVEEFTPSADSKNYRFGPEFFEDDENKESKQKSRQRKRPEKVIEEEYPKSVKQFKNGDICEKVRRKNLVCMVCINEDTNAKYEQCQYSKNPRNQGYTYGSEKSYTSKKSKPTRPERHTDQEPQISERKYVYTKIERQVFGDDDSDSYIRKQRNAPTKIASDKDNLEFHEALDLESNRRMHHSDYDRIQDQSNPSKGSTYQLLGETNGTSSSKLFPQNNETFEEYFSRVFPQFEVFGKLSSSVLGPVADLDTLPALPGLQQNPHLMPNPARGKEDLKMLAQTLETFHTKDWTNCTKKDFGKMLCYQCPQASGVNEECMFVENSTPTASPSSDESTAANILTAVQSAILSGHMDGTDKYKGDYEGTGTVSEKQQSGWMKSKKKKNNYGSTRQQAEPSEPQDVVWESGKESLSDSLKNIDVNNVMIFFNNTT